jgi:L-fucose mutarotase
MLKNIPPIITPDLMKTMMEMGHGDELIIADGNYPSFSQNVKTISMDGHGVEVILDAILGFFPLDTYVKNPIALMRVMDGDPTVPKIWDSYYKIFKKYGYNKSLIYNIDRFDFYDRSKRSFAIISTSEKELYANILLKKGVVT